MRKPFYWLGPPLLAAGIFLFALAGDFRAQDAQAGERQKAEEAVRSFLYEVTQKGVVLYNKQRNYDACARLYGRALLAVEPLLDHRPDLQQVISAGLAKAQQSTIAWQHAIALREVLDRVRGALGKSGGPMTDKALPADKDKLPPPPDKGLKVEAPPKPFVDLGSDKVVSDRKPGPKADKRVTDKATTDALKPFLDQGPQDKASSDKKPPRTDAKPLDKKQPQDKATDATKEEKGPNPDEATVRGRVTFQGKPLSSGFVTLVGQDGRKYSASIKADGNYQFRKVTVPPGQYRVAIDNSVTLGKGQPRGVAVPARYRDPNTSGLTARINPRENIFDISLQ